MSSCTSNTKLAFTSLPDWSVIIDSFIIILIIVYTLQCQNNINHTYILTHATYPPSDSRTCIFIIARLPRQIQLCTYTEEPDSLALCLKPGLHFERISRAYTQTILRTWGAFSRPTMPIYAEGIAQVASVNTPTMRRLLHVDAGLSLANSPKPLRIRKLLRDI